METVLICLLLFILMSILGSEKIKWQEKNITKVLILIPIGNFIIFFHKIIHYALHAARKDGYALSPPVIANAALAIAAFSFILSIIAIFT